MILENLIHDMKALSTRLTCVADLEGNRYLIAAAKITDDEHQKLKQAQQSPDSMEYLDQAMKYLRRGQ